MTAGGPGEPALGDRVRLDVWLDVACIARTRSHAKELCDAGRVEVGGLPAKAHRLVQAGDRLRVSLAPGRARELVVRGVRDTHVARALARELYEDVTPPPTAAEIEQRLLARIAPPPAPSRGRGRPEKLARRQFDRLRGRSG